MSENIDKKLQQIIDLEIRELYDLAYGEIADED